MELDYYDILGVSEDAGMGEIKAAYRQRAVECHPDRGGAHEKMLLINEAWEVLSNPYARMHYDYGRRNRFDFQAQREAAQERARARRRARKYPRKWNDFAAWLDGFMCDFTEAEYLYPEDKPTTSLYPTVYYSISGKLFCIFGALVGFFMAVLVLILLRSLCGKFDFAASVLQLFAIAFYLIFIPLGANVGCRLHEKIGRGLGFFIAKR